MCFQASAPLTLGPHIFACGHGVSSHPSSPPAPLWRTPLFLLIRLWRPAIVAAVRTCRRPSLSFELPCRPAGSKMHPGIRLIFFSHFATSWALGNGDLGAAQAATEYEASALVLSIGRLYTGHFPPRKSPQIAPNRLKSHNPPAGQNHSLRSPEWKGLGWKIRCRFFWCFASMGREGTNWLWWRFCGRVGRMSNCPCGHCVFAGDLSRGKRRQPRGCFTHKHV